VTDELDLVGATDIAAMLGITRQRVNQLVVLAGFPTPVGQLRRTRIWKREDVEAWARATGRVATGHEDAADEIRDLHDRGRAASADEQRDG
jgi:hypothetical protein